MAAQRERREAFQLRLRHLGRILRATENTRRYSAFDSRGQSRPGLDEDPGPLACGGLEFLWRSNIPDVGVQRDASVGEFYTVTLMMGTNDVSNGRVKKDDEATGQSELHS